MSEEEGTTPRVRFIPDFFVPFPGELGDRSFPCLAGGVRDSWSLTRPPAARSAAHFRTVVTLKRGPSSLSRVSTEVTFGQGALSIFPFVICSELLRHDLGIWGKRSLRAACNM